MEKEIVAIIEKACVLDERVNVGFYKTFTKRLQNTFLFLLFLKPSFRIMSA